MYRLETTADFVVATVACLLVSVLGALMIAFPTQPLPENRDAYRVVGGVLRELKDESRRRTTEVTFVVDTESGTFVSNAPPVRDAAKHWRVGRTFIQFFVLSESASGSRGLPVPAYGVSAPGHPLRSLQEDIAFHNAGLSMWPRVMALGIGLFGLLVVGLCWRKRRAR